MRNAVLADPRFWGWLAIALAVAGPLYALSPIVAPPFAKELRHLRAAYLASPLYGGPK